PATTLAVPVSRSLRVLALLRKLGHKRPLGDRRDFAFQKVVVHSTFGIQPWHLGRRLRGDFRPAAVGAALVSRIGAARAVAAGTPNSWIVRHRDMGAVVSFPDEL